MYLSGCAAHERLAAQVAAGIGLMLTPRAGYRPAIALRVSAWAADNGCYSAGDRFNLGEYVAWLERMRPAIATCLFATAPDVVTNAEATMQRSAPVLPLLRELGYAPALVGQDGLERLTIPWDAFDCLFVGGSTVWKLGVAAQAIVREAKRRGKWVHMGRVNSGKRLVYAKRIGVDSCDGTYMQFNPAEAVDRMGRWLHIANTDRQLLLPMEVQS